MAEVEISNLIAGVKFVHLKSYADDRGKFLETFRRSWFPERSWDIVQANCSYSRAGVLRGLHYHHRQVDYWFVPTGVLRVGLADLRPGSPTYAASQTLEIGEQNPIGVFIPIGVAHGFLALTDVVLTYIVDNYYDGDDERGVAWNDPTLAVAWGTTEPIISARDQQNPLLQHLPPEQVPPPYQGQ
jgi:dTDP-4-dehydrorhamnose 3,5-epimerase